MVFAYYDAFCVVLKAFYLPNKDRPNLRVMINATVTRAVTGGTAGGQLRATGVEFIVDDRMHVASAKEEVILSAGYVTHR